MRTYNVACWPSMCYPLMRPCLSAYEDESVLHDRMCRCLCWREWPELVMYMRAVC